MITGKDLATIAHSLVHEQIGVDVEIEALLEGHGVVSNDFRLFVHDEMERVLEGMNDLEHKNMPELLHNVTKAAFIHGFFVGLTAGQQ